MARPIRPVDHGAPLRRVIRPPEVRRAQLLDAAMALFGEAGVAPVSVADITTRAGVAKGTFYLYFASREDLLEALRIRVAEAASAHLASLALPTDAAGWPAYLDQLTDAAISFLCEHWSIHEVLAHRPHEHVAGRGEMKVVDEHRAHLRAIMEAGVTARAIWCDDPSIGADLLYELLHAAGHRACGHESDAAAVAAVARQMVRGALLAR